jgi:hypothetical protein
MGDAVARFGSRAMPHVKYSAKEVESRGEAIYSRVRGEVEPGNAGKFFVVDVESGDYEVETDDLEATTRLLARRPHAILYGLRIGHPAAYRLGLRASVEPR